MGVTRTLVTIAAALAILAACGAKTPPVPRSPAGSGLRTVAFDNVYGNVASLTVYASVDGGMEQKLPATCNAKTCTFTIPLSNERHQLLLAVEQNGKRGEATKVTLDAGRSR
jgi:hypothetical protein